MAVNSVRHSFLGNDGYSFLVAVFHLFYIKTLKIRPIDKSAQLISLFFFLNQKFKTYVLGTQNNHLYEMVLLSTQNKCLN